MALGSVSPRKLIQLCSRGVGGYVLEAVQGIKEGLWGNSSRRWAAKVERVIRVGFMKKVRFEQRHEGGERIGHAGVWESAGLKNGKFAIPKSPGQELARHVTRQAKRLW